MPSPKDSVFGFMPRYSDEDTDNELGKPRRETDEASSMGEDLRRLVSSKRKASVITRDCHRINVHVSDSQYKKLRHFCADHGVTLQGLVSLGLNQVERAIDDYE